MYRSSRHLQGSPVRPRLVAVLAAALLALTLAVPASAQNVARPTSALDDARAAYNDARAEADEAAARHEEAVSAYYALENEIDSLESEIETAEAGAELLRSEAREIARNAYTGENGDLIETLEFDDVLDAARRTQFSDGLKADDDDKLEELARVEEDLSARRESLDTARAEQSDVVARLDEEAAGLEEKLAESQALLAQLEEQQRIEEERRAAAAAAAEQAAAEQEAAENAAPPSTSAPQPAPAPSPGGSGGTPGGAFNLVCPVPGSSFTDSWGAPRSTGGHQAVDMLAPIGTPNYAVVSGTASPRNMGIGGYGVALSGDDGNLYYYIHLSPGTGVSGHVSQGQFIGSGGDSGNAAGTPHTHFEIHPGHGPAINPYPHVRPIC